MKLETRKILDRSFTGLGLVAVVLMAASLVVLVAPIAVRGAGAIIFRGTVEHRLAMSELFGHGDREAVAQEVAEARQARQPIYQYVTAFQEEFKALGGARQRELRSSFAEVKKNLNKLLGPMPDEPQPVLPRDRYGETRWDRAQQTLQKVLIAERYDYRDPTRLGVKVLSPRVDEFKGTKLEPLFGYLEAHVAEVLRPRWTFYWGFLTDEPRDANFFGGLWPALLGTFYLTVGAMIFAVPLGVMTAIYLVEYAGQGRIVSLLRTCISTLAGVPSIVFGLFGLAFFINELHVSSSKSVLAGSLTLALLVLPTVIRASEEAFRAVPQTYKEAALSVGAGTWRTIATVILPAALPGILTGIIISMGRAAGETAPIIFTAAVSVGRPLDFWQVFDQPTPALPWNIYNLATEHEAVDQIRHVQYGMVLVLVALVLLLNVSAIWLRARIARKLRG